MSAIQGRSRLLKSGPAVYSVRFVHSPSKKMPWRNLPPSHPFPFPFLHPPPLVLSPSPSFRRRTPLIQIGGRWGSAVSSPLGERCELPHWGLGRSLPSRNRIWLHFSLKIWHLLATVLIIFLRINWPNLNFALTSLFFSSRNSVTHFASLRVPLDVSDSVEVLS